MRRFKIGLHSGTCCLWFTGTAERCVIAVEHPLPLSVNIYSEPVAGPWNRSEIGGYHGDVISVTSVENDDAVVSVVTDDPFETFLGAVAAVQSG